MKSGKSIIRGVIALAVATLLLMSACAVPELTVGAASAVSIEKDVVYGSAEGVELKMDIYRPQYSAGRLPAVLYLHGGGWVQGDKSAVAEGKQAQELLSRGYVLAAINYRLAPWHRFPAQIQDIKTAVRFLRAKAADYNIDPERIAAWGASAGGHLAALLGLTGEVDEFDGLEHREESSRVRAVVDMFGPADLTVDFEGAGELLMRLVFGTSDPAELKAASPTSYVTEDAPPFLIVHGDKDRLVPLRQSQELFDRLKAAGAPAELIVVENGGHGFAPMGGNISPSLTEITRLVADFLDRNLR